MTKRHPRITGVFFTAKRQAPYHRGIVSHPVCGASYCVIMNKQWNTGRPPRKGWYQCRIDGIEIKLYCFICELNPRRWYWVDETQAQIDDEVEWLG